MIAALALEMQVLDRDQIVQTYPNVDAVVASSKSSIERNLSIFGNPLIKNIRHVIGQKQLIASNIFCIGSINFVTKIAEEQRYGRISGWIYNLKVKRPPASLFFVDHNNNIVGYAITGMPRPDVALVINKKANYSGFQGYILASARQGPLFLMGNNPNCTLQDAIKIK